jgi:tRNA 2-thiouridine synthesizing protein A
MAVQIINAVGLKCPQPILKIAAKSPDMVPGDILEVTADCPTFEKDVRAWCDRLKRVLLSIKDEGGGKIKVQIQF